MKRSLFALLVTGLVASCTTTADIDTALQQNLPKVCSALTTGYVAFAAAAATGAFKDATIRKVNNAYNGVVVICDDPTRVTTPDMIIRVTTAVVVITSAMKEAR